jgi:hypothetical protein
MIYVFKYFFLIILLKLAKKEKNGNVIFQFENYVGQLVLFFQW